MEVGDLADDMEASTAPEMALEKSYIMNSSGLPTVSSRALAVSFQDWNGSVLSELTRSHRWPKVCL
jgi:hypothetical protein